MCGKNEGKKRGCEGCLQVSCVSGFLGDQCHWEMALPGLALAAPPASRSAMAPLLWIPWETALLLGGQSLSTNHTLWSQYGSYMTGVWLGCGWELQVGLSGTHWAWLCQTGRILGNPCAVQQMQVVVLFIYAEKKAFSRISLNKLKW